MTKLKLKNILSELLKERVQTPPEHKKINDKLMQIAKRGFEDEKGESIKESEEKDYIVTYWVRDNDDKNDYDKTVKALSTEDAIEKVKKDAPRLARNFTAKLK